MDVLIRTSPFVSCLVEEMVLENCCLPFVSKRGREQLGICVFAHGVFKDVSLHVCICERMRASGERRSCRSCEQHCMSSSDVIHKMAHFISRPILKNQWPNA